MAKIGADIGTSHKEAGFIAECKKRQNHDKANVAELLAVPRYADLLENGEVGGSHEQEGSAPLSGLVKSHNGWQMEMAKWVQEEQAQILDFDKSDNELANVMYGCKRLKWLPQSLELLFGGSKETDVDKQLRQIRRQQVYTEKA
ncbi:hypothetical protein C0991_001300 [Blastosporella zonata]|nr:hypothetical protein C0991_001300 [Blastosporella zonata]